MLSRIISVLAVLSIAIGAAVASELDENFVSPPPAARPWVYWFPLSGNLTKAGITADLEAMARVGVGGVLYMEVDQGAPKGSADFAGPQWRELLKHACSEAHRLGLEINMNNDAGWCGSGGPWITPDLSMQKVVFSEVEIDGGKAWEIAVPQPKGVKDFYRDIAILAMPAPQGNQRIADIQGKASFKPQRFPPQPAAFSEVSASAVIARENIVDLTGKTTWDAPPGKWLVIRFGHTTTGKDNHPAPLSGRGLECDKFNREAAGVMFEGLMGKLIADNKPLVGQGKVLVSTHIDSWEVGSQNWTPKMRDEFQARRGYDLWKFLPAYTGRIVDSVEITERFLWDLRQTVSDLVVENYAGEFRRLAKKNGLRLSIEAYDSAPTADVAYAGQADEPMAEFWKVGYDTVYSCIEMSSSAHVYGKPILGAEAFTSTDKEKWLEHPGSIKALGDWAFCSGINRFVFHRYAAQPWVDRAPGMSMGPWGLHYERTQTWWEQSKAWHAYLARCQYLLQKGLFVADVLYLQPEGAPQRFTPPPGVWAVAPGKNGAASAIRGGYNFDGCSPDVVLSRLSVSHGQLMLPDGMSYRVLVLPDVETMSPPLLRKIEKLIRDGATVFAPRRPLKAPGLTRFPECDSEVAKVAEELWGAAQPPAELTERKIGEGRLIWGGTLAATRPATSDHPVHFGPAKWIWYKEGNPAQSAPAGTRYFRKTVEIDPAKRITSAKLVMTADNTFECAVNGKPVGSGDDFHQGYVMDVTAAVKPGANTITVTAVNTTDVPSPAGLIGLLAVEFEGGALLEVPTDHTWESAQAQTAAWSAALELGANGMQPWGGIGVTSGAKEHYPDATVVHAWLAKNSVAPDFAADKPLNYIHKNLRIADIYFVANPEAQEIETTASFRVAGKSVELWWPDTGRMERVTFTEQAGCTRVPLSLDPGGSVFVVFRSDAVASAAVSAPPRKLETVQEISGPWEVSFDPKWGGPARSVNFAKLQDWSTHADSGVRYYSGTATYNTSFQFTAAAGAQSVVLDLGEVAVMADVIVNGKSFGTLWKRPYRVDVGSALKAGENTLQLRVVNLWINRQIGDEQLPEDCDRNKNGTLKEWPAWVQEGKPSPTGRYTFGSWKLWKKDDKLAPSGLLGPVTLKAPH